MQNGQVVETGKWGDRVEISRLQMQCFKVTWTANVLHKGIGVPRIVDPGGNSTTQGENVVQQAEKKGLRWPMFQSADTVRGIAICRTPGEMVLEASKEVKPLSSHNRPLVDPVQDILPNLRNPPIKPIRPPFLDLDAIEEKVSQRLPLMLTRESLGFSPVMFLFNSVVPLLMCCMALRLCRPFGLALRRFKRASLKRVADNAYLMEEGSLSQTTPPSMLPPSLLRPLRRLVSSPNLSSPSPATQRGLSPRPIRAPTCPFVARAPDDDAHVAFAFTLRASVRPIGTSTASQYHSHASSPSSGAVSIPEQATTAGHGATSLSSRSVQFHPLIL